MTKSVGAESAETKRLTTKGGEEVGEWLNGGLVIRRRREGGGQKTEGGGRRDEAASWVGLTSGVVLNGKSVAAPKGQVPGTAKQ